MGIVVGVATIFGVTLVLLDVEVRVDLVVDCSGALVDDVLLLDDLEFSVFTEDFVVVNFEVWLVEVWVLVVVSCLLLEDLVFCALDEVEDLVDEGALTLLVVDVTRALVGDVFFDSVTVIVFAFSEMTAEICTAVDFCECAKI